MGKSICFRCKHLNPLNNICDKSNEDVRYYGQLISCGNYEKADTTTSESVKRNMDNEGWTIDGTFIGERVDHPSYYQGKIEVIDFIEDKGFGFHLGNAIKYIARAGRKSTDTEAEDLRKAIWYIERYLEVKNG